MKTNLKRTPITGEITLSGSELREILIAHINGDTPSSAVPVIISSNVDSINIVRVGATSPDGSISFGPQPAEESERLLVVKVTIPV